MNKKACLCGYDDRVNCPEHSCNNCGACCKVQVDGIWIDCKYRKDGKCGVYDFRLGQQVYPGVYCGPRENCGYDYPGCPYNSGAPLHPSVK